jgi:cytochrome c551/c552
MKKAIATCILLFAVNAQAVEGEALAKQWACLGCHSIQHIGISYPPAFVRVAEKYRNDPEQIKYSIRYGKGKMPAHASLTEAEISILTEWILSIK